MVAARVGPLEPGASCDPLVVIELAGRRESEKWLAEAPVSRADRSASASPSRSFVAAERSQGSASKLLPILDYYLTFIHYFGFSINPNDDRAPQALSRRVKRVAAAAVALDQLGPLDRKCGRRSSASERETIGGGGLAPAKLCRKHSLRLAPLVPVCLQRTLNTLKTIGTNWRRLLKASIKLAAISLTTFLTMNHVIVLIDYVYRRSKVLTELMLELRLVITKLSALIFVIAWHRNQSKVRLLIRLIKSTSVNILTSEHDNQDAPQEAPWGAAEPADSACQRLAAIDRRVLKWWALCMSVTIIHLSLSEAEIKSAHHLWEWLDDYSLHQLSNQTTSNATLFAMATFDNYMYTVHVYGTRLVGSSIICIVCTFQLENITCLRRQALNLLQAYDAAGSGGGLAGRRDWPSASCECGPSGVAAGCADRGEQLFCRSLLYVLAESDWKRVERNRRQLAPVGRLTRPLAHLWRLIAACCRRVLAGDAPAISRHLSDRRAATPSSSAREAADGIGFSPAFGSADPIRGTPNGAAQLRRPLTPAPSANSQSVPMLRNYLDDYLARERAPSWGSNQRCGGARTQPVVNDWLWPRSCRTAPRLPIIGGAGRLRAAARNQANSKSGDNHQPGGDQWELGHQVELQLEALARKYELVRTVNSRIDNCFGHMLLSQYSFLFLMSCIDVVFFSLSFNPNTKTKYIIVSGMILLWLPYLLLYKYASDVGLASKKLLTSVRRLACLVLVLQLSNGREATNTLDWKRCARSRARASPQLVSRATILNKLEHVFEPSHLTIVGLMAMNKFFLLNFAKIVITASVMTIQFISKR